MDTTHDGGYILCGSNSNLNGGDFLIIKTDSMGNEVWRQTNQLHSGLLNDNYLNAIHENPDHTFLAMGKITPGINNSDSYIVKLDSTGTILWSHIYNLSPFTFERASDGLQLNDSEYVFLTDRPSPFNDYCLTAIDKNTGDSVSTKIFNFSPFCSGQNSNHLYKTNIGYLITTNLIDTSIIFNHGFRKEVPFIFTLDSNLNLINEHSWPDTIPSRLISIDLSNISSYALSLESFSWYTAYQKFTVADTNGSLLTSGQILNSSIGTGVNAPNRVYTSFSTGMDYGCVVAYDSMCDSLWEICHSVTYMNAPQFIFKDPRNTKVVAAGSIDDGNQTSAVSYLLGINDNFLTEINNPAVPEVKVSIIPNPAYDNCEIVLHELNLQSGILSVVLFDSYGNKVYESKLYDKNTIIKRRELKNGLYHLCIYNTDKLIYTGNLIFN
jgi:hypothetical protein